MAAATADGFQKIQITRDDTTFDAYVVGKENAPGIVVLQEWWGVDFEVKNHAQNIAKIGSGYRALIPDLYRGKVGLDVAEAQHLMDGLDWQGAIKDISASVKWLKATGSPKVGVTGYCMGGALAIASAVLIPEVDAVVAFYGVPSSELADPSQVKAPVQAHFGELDSIVGFSDIRQLNPYKALKSSLSLSFSPNPSMALSKTLTLAFFLLSTLALTVKSQDIHEILPAYGLPPALFPNVENQASIDTNGQLFLKLDSRCFVRLPSSGTLLHYDNKVTGVISYGRIEDIKGIQMRRGANTWVPVTGIRSKIVEGKMEFQLGGLSELLPMDDFEKVPHCNPSEAYLKFRGIPFAEV